MKNQQTLDELLSLEGVSIISKNGKTYRVTVTVTELIKDETFKKILRLCADLETKGSDTWIEWAGHVSQLSVRICPQGFDSDQETKFNEQCYVIEPSYGKTLEGLLCKLNDYVEGDYKVHLTEEIIDAEE